MSTAEYAFQFDEPVVDERAREHADEESAAAADSIRTYLKEIGGVSLLTRGGRGAPREADRAGRPETPRTR